MNKQREIIYKRRLQSLEGEDLEDECKDLVGDIAAATLEEGTIETSDHAEDWDLAELRRSFGMRLGVDLDFETVTHDRSLDEIKEIAVKAVLDRYGERETVAGPDLFRQFERFASLTTIDANWKDHLYGLDRLREGIGLRAYGQKDPLLEYKKEAFQLFSDLMDRIDLTTAERLMKTEIRTEAPAPSPVGVAHQPSLVGAGARPAAPPPGGPGGRGAPGPALPPGSSRPATASKSVGRNDPCPCGSGKKYKKCHGKNV
jgi:preprotein translocase subunit SecA